LRRSGESWHPEGLVCILVGFDEFGGFWWQEECLVVKDPKVAKPTIGAPREEDSEPFDMT